MQAVIGIVLSVLGLLMVVFGWFIIKVFSSVTDSIKDLNKTTFTLSNTISGMNAIQLTYQGGIDEMKDKCSGKHDRINLRLDKHEEKLNSLDTKIQLIEKK